MVAVSPYQTALALKRPAPNHVLPGLDSDRIQAYATYEDIWNNVSTAFDELLRKSDDPIARRYVPAVRGIVEATNRYLAQDLKVNWTPVPGATVTDDALTEFRARMDDLSAREELVIKFMSLKRWWLIKGDAIFHLSADPSKPEGSRIRINEIQPEEYFPIMDPSDGERRTGCYLASLVLNDEDEEIVQRIEYHRVMNEEDAAELSAPLGSVITRIGFYETDGWDDREEDAELKAVDPPAWASGGAWDALLEGVVLPAQITSIPVYHFRNNRRGGPAGTFGLSEIQGLETILAGLIQNTSDEDVAIALQGIGMYWTDSGRPRDAQGKEVDWVISAASVIELEKDGKFGRVAGVGSVEPMQQHINLLNASAREATAVPDIAIGRIDAQAAQSGVALRIEFMPILAKNLEKEQELKSKLNQMFFDLVNSWFPAYEGWQPLPVRPSITFADPIPTDRTAVLSEILQMVAARVVSVEWAQKELAERLGYAFPAGMIASIVKEQQSLLDLTGARIDAAATAPPADV